MPVKKQCCSRCYCNLPMTQKFYKKKVDGSYFKRCIECNAVTNMYNIMHKQRRWCKSQCGTFHNIQNMPQVVRPNTNSGYDAVPFKYDAREFPLLKME